MMGAGPAAGAPMDTGLGAPVGPPGGSVGSLIVGAAVGLGGKLMRTVSFFGWTLPVSFFGGSTAPVKFGVGTGFGGMSAIMFAVQDKLGRGAVKFNSKTKPVAGGLLKQLGQVFSSINSRRAPPSSWSTKLVEYTPRRTFGSCMMAC